MACREKPTWIGSVTATICMTPASSRRCTRWRTAASDRPTALPIVAYGRRPSSCSCSMMRLDDVVERGSRMRAMVLAGGVLRVTAPS